MILVKTILIDLNIPNFILKASYILLPGVSGCVVFGGMWGLEGVGDVCILWDIHWLYTCTMYKKLCNNVKLLILIHVSV